MMNCVDTAARTVTCSRAMSARLASASKRADTTQGTPRRVGVTCAVQTPNPNGAGSVLMNTSSGDRSPAATAWSWKANQRRWWCITHLGSPVVPDVEFNSQRSSASIGRPPTTADPSAALGGSFSVVDGRVTPAGPRSDADDDRAGSFDAEVTGVHRRTVRHEYRDPVPGLRANFDELSGDPVGALVVVTPRDALVVTDVCRVVR